MNNMKNHKKIKQLKKSLDGWKNKNPYIEKKLRREIELLESQQNRVVKKKLGLVK